MISRSARTFIFSPSKCDLPTKILAVMDSLRNFQNLIHNFRNTGQNSVARAAFILLKIYVMEYILPKLGFSYDALEPYVDTETMRLHHQGHHLAYVEKFNAALAKAPQLSNVPLEELLSSPDNAPVDIREDLRNHGGGHYNHSLFWKILSPQKVELKGEFLVAVRSQYGNVENFKKIFTGVANSHFGSGYAWVCMDRNARLVVKSLPNQDTPLLDGCDPLLLLDLWEHAYYLRYKFHRPEFVKGFWDFIDWRVVEDLFVKALMKKHKQIPAEARH